MDENIKISSPDVGAVTVPESPKPLAFTIDFGGDKKVDIQRHKTLAEKFQKRHKRGQSLSKLEDSVTPTAPKQHPLSGNLPRKSSFQSEGYFSSDEKNERAKNARASIKRSELTLLLKNVTTDRMTQSFPNSGLPCIASPEDCELKDVSSPELDLISPFSPSEQENLPEKPQVSSPIVNLDKEDSVFVDSGDFDFDKKSDTVSDTGTYTLDADNYSEEQKARMSIDMDFRIEKVSVQKKTEEYVKSLTVVRERAFQNTTSRPLYLGKEVTTGIRELNLVERPIAELKSPVTESKQFINRALSPMLSPTQNMSLIGDKIVEKPLNNGECEVLNKTFTKIMFPSPRSKQDGLEKALDQGTVISVTSSGAFRTKNEEKKKLERKLSLVKSEVQVEAYIDGKVYKENVVESVNDRDSAERTKRKLTANIVNVQSIDLRPDVSVDSSDVVSASLVFAKISNNGSGCLPPAVGGKTSPSKIPSPIHTLSRPRSRNSISSLNVDFSDTEIILKPTQNYINSLQQRLSLDSDPDSDYDAKYGLQLNNTAHLLKQRTSHTRHNSLDDRTMNNKLEHFQSKNLQSIDQTYSNLLNQYSQNKVMHKIQNSPNNSPIRRSSSFSTKNQLNSIPKNINITGPQKDTNLINSPNLTRNISIQRSSSTASIKPNYISNRRSSVTDHKKIDRSQFGDTESSSEDDFEKNLQQRKGPGNISNTRCNRAFSLRRARIDNEPTTQLKCPNTPEMRRKAFHTDVKQERAISVDRKPMKTNDVQSRYMLNISKRGTPPPLTKDVKNVPKSNITPVSAPKLTNKPQIFSRTDSGRFSMRTTKPSGANNTPRSGKKDSGKKQSGGRSNSSLSSREVEFQNWKRRKSYDPMKAAAEGKRKEMQKRQTLGQGLSPMTQSFTESSHSPDSSPSHSSSVHRSQSFHGTAALEQLISSDEEDLTLSADEGFSPPTPSPCELSPARASLRHTLWERIHH